ncbi:hypothetical protein H0O00_00940 [Candidatus Micrarchaeota archaeon]|nr:hypothetical protein [Candidatus Micrarchaeota archaeon]
MNRFVILLLAIGLMSLPAFAEESTETGENTTVATLDDSTNESDVEINESEVGSLPGDWDYGFKRFFEGVDNFFTWDKSESAIKHAKYGKLRAIEAHLMTKKAQGYEAMNETEAEARALEIVEQLVAESNEEQAAAESELEDAVDEGSANETEVEQVQNYTRNSIIVLQRVYEKAPESAKDGLARALNNSINNYERHVEKMEEKEQKGNQTIEENETEDEDENETESDTVNGNGNKTKNKDNETETGHQPDELNQTKGKDKNETQNGNGKGKDGNESGDEGETENEEEDD